MPTRSNVQRAGIGAPPTMPPTVYDASADAGLIERAADARNSVEAAGGGRLPATKLSTRQETAKVTVRLDPAFAARFRGWLSATGRTQQAAVILAVHEAMERDGF